MEEKVINEEIQDMDMDMDMDMVVEEETNTGDIKIAQDVIATIAGMATSEIEGIAGMSGGITDGFAGMLGRKQLTKGVKVETVDKTAKIDVYIIVKYGFNIAAVAEQTQVNIKEAVETMTALEVTSVNVNVQGISFEKEKVEEIEEVIEPEVTVEL